MKLREVGNSPVAKHPCVVNTAAPLRPTLKEELVAPGAGHAVDGHCPAVKLFRDCTCCRELPCPCHTLHETASNEGMKSDLGPTQDNLMD